MADAKPKAKATAAATETKPEAKATADAKSLDTDAPKESIFSQKWLNRFWNHVIFIKIMFCVSNMICCLKTLGI